MSFANVNDVLRRIKKRKGNTNSTILKQKEKERPPPKKTPKKNPPKPHEVEDGAGEEGGHISKSTISTWGE